MRSSLIGGVATWSNDNGQVHEEDTVTCCHCNSIVHVPAKASPAELGGWCGMCAQYTCRACAGESRCVPFERKLEAWERRRASH